MQKTGRMTFMRHPRASSPLPGFVLHDACDRGHRRGIEGRGILMSVAHGAFVDGM